MIKAGIIGATGYGGVELLRILSSHPEVELVYLGSRSYQGQRYSEITGSFRNAAFDQICENKHIEEVAASCDVVFLALPHGIASGQLTQEILSKTVIIDLGADFRLPDVETYQKWYEVEHRSPDLMKQAVYGLPELYRDKIAKTNLIANPGCYTTCSILSLAPIIAEGIPPLSDTGEPLYPIIIDAKSGVSGAGRKAVQALHFAEVNESIKAYKVGDHRHTPEIETYLGEVASTKVTVQFTPHLVPMNRGILTSAYLRPESGRASGYDDSKLQELYRSFYPGEPFVRILPPKVYPETRWVRGSNYIDIGIRWDQRTGNIMVLGAIDNLVKGAAGQAVQNMNIRFKLPEAMGLESPPLFP
ncbi:MAG TPA: N-acetyl-gamma-glutamyl-phosphate reductase [Sediminispirochaeta sp.]|nr:N-acetyl-gamma-glutamyl-phosphate reductase [Sediminispirochaeta sp.]